MRTDNQVEVIIFRQSIVGETQFLMLKRTPERGGFWQPVTGGVESGESIEDAALREVVEEVQITQISKLINTGYTFEFKVGKVTKIEYVFGALISNDQAISLSSEHTGYKWVTFDEAMNHFLKYPGNKEGLKQLKLLLNTG